MKKFRDQGRIAHTEEIEPDPEHHGALTKLGFKHLKSSRTMVHDRSWVGATGNMSWNEVHTWTHHSTKPEVLKGAADHFEAQDFRLHYDDSELMPLGPNHYSEHLRDGATYDVVEMNTSTQRTEVIKRRAP